MKKISDAMLGILERLAEMFPKQHYQNELEQYIVSKNPTTSAEVDHWTKEFQHRTSGRSFI